MNGTAIAVAKALGHIHHAFSTEPDAQPNLKPSVRLVPQQPFDPCGQLILANMSAPLNLLASLRFRDHVLGPRPQVVAAEHQAAAQLGKRVVNTAPEALGHLPAILVTSFLASPPEIPQPVKAQPRGLLLSIKATGIGSMA
jgi:hypothetical protein